MVSWRPACSSSFFKYCVEEEIREEEEEKEKNSLAKAFIFLLLRHQGMCLLWISKTIFVA